MIKIEVPQFDYEDVTLENVREIPYNTSGIYLIYDKDGELLYVGQSHCLRSRIHAHFTGHGQSHTHRYAWAFYKCKAFVETDPASKNVYECYLINFLKPPLNKQMNEYKGHNFLLNKKADPKNYIQHIADLF